MECDFSQKVFNKTEKIQADNSHEISSLISSEKCKMKRKLEMCICKTLCPQLYACPYKMPIGKGEIPYSPNKSANMKALACILNDISCYNVYKVK